MNQVVVPPTAYDARVWIASNRSTVLRIASNRQASGWVRSKVPHYDIQCGKAEHAITAQEGTGGPNAENRQRSGEEACTIAGLKLPKNLVER